MRGFQHCKLVAILQVTNILSTHVEASEFYGDNLPNNIIVDGPRAGIGEAQRRSFPCDVLKAPYTDSFLETRHQLNRIEKIPL